MRISDWSSDVYSSDLKTVTDSNAAVIENRSQLIDSFARGEKPKERWRIGTEHEKFVYAKSDLHAPSYDEPGVIRPSCALTSSILRKIARSRSPSAPGSAQRKPFSSPTSKIGRASGRAGVCQYGKLSGVAVT